MYYGHPPFPGWFLHAYYEIIFGITLKLCKMLLLVLFGFSSPIFFVYRNIWPSPSLRQAF